MEIRKFAASLTVKESTGVMMHDFMADVTIEEAKLRAPVKFPGKRVVKVDITKIRGPLPRWDPETGDLTDRVDWVGHADVHLEESDDGTQVHGERR